LQIQLKFFDSLLFWRPLEFRLFAAWLPARMTALLEVSHNRNLISIFTVPLQLVFVFACYPVFWLSVGVGTSWAAKTLVLLLLVMARPGQKLSPLNHIGRNW
jgi:hypothetical protein